MKIFIKANLTLLLANLYLITPIFKRAIPYCTQITAVLSCVVIAAYCVTHISLLRKLLDVLKPFIYYGLFLLVSGAILFLLNGYNISLIVSFFEMLMIMIISAYIIISDGSYDFLLIIGSIIGTIVSVYSLTVVGDVYNRVQLSGNMSENTTALVIMFGLISTYLLDRKFYNRYVKLFINLVGIVAIVYTASRQALVLLAILYLRWFLPSFMKGHGGRVKISVSKLLFIVFVIGLAVFLYTKTEMVSTFLRSKLYYRLIGQNTSTEVSDTSRLDHYRLAFYNLLMHPLIGAGYKNMEIYTHSTYGEVMGGNGAIGLILFFRPLYKRFREEHRLYKRAGSFWEGEYYYRRITVWWMFIAMMLFRAVHYYIPSVILIMILMTDPLKREERVVSYSPQRNEYYEYS